MLHCSQNISLSEVQKLAGQYYEARHGIEVVGGVEKVKRIENEEKEEAKSRRPKLQARFTSRTVT